jgi:DNA-directed RNA polymerase subunit omega
MVFPLEELIKYNGNMYAITCASARRAYQIAMMGNDYDYGEEKVVSLAAREVFTGEVQFKLVDDAPIHEIDGLLSTLQAE